MPNKKFIASFRASVSNERLDKYRQRGVAGGDENLLLHYAWNVALAESFYPALQCMEIALRNSVHDAASVSYGTGYWFDVPGLLDRKSLEGIATARFDLEKAGKVITAPGIIAEQNFGFWTALFNKNQEQVLWPRIYRNSFPYLPKYMRKRTTVSGRLNEIRKFRNRIFHHEPIWYITDLRKKYDRILELIHWISPSMAEFTAAVDRFPVLYGSGMVAFQTELERKFSHIIRQPTPEAPPAIPLVPSP